jgi:hypothetical protein
MMLIIKYLRGGSYITPNLCYIKETKGVKCNPYITPPALAGDVAYWDGSKVKTIPLSKWNTSLGTAIGVVVVPEGFAPDGKVRIVSLYGVDDDGNQSSSDEDMMWGLFNSNVASLTNYSKVPTTDNAGSTSSGSDDEGYLPSDNFTGATSFVDPKSKYNSTSNMIPSPYLGDNPNPEYYKTISGNNALSDFNGLSNTETLVGLGSDYVAANACWKYKDGSSNLQWYLPAMGELGYIIPRLNEINNTLTALGGLSFSIVGFFWSSSEAIGDNAYCVASSGRVDTVMTPMDYKARPFTLIE